MIFKQIISVIAFLRENEDQLYFSERTFKCEYKNYFTTIKVYSRDLKALRTPLIRETEGD